MIHCPSCRHPIRIVDVLPGRFTPKCPSCRAPFILTIPDGDGGEAVVETTRTEKSDPSAPSLEAIPTSLDAPAAVLGYGRLPRGVPRFLGRCLVLKLLGHGPRGRSLLARPLSLAGRVVLKVVSTDRVKDAIFVERFLREALATAQLSSPHIIPIVDIGRDRASTFTAMEYVSGSSLAEELARRGKIEPRTAAAWVLQAARGLAVAHVQGIWHRDVKPENLRLTADGLVVVDDLGLETTPSLAAAESVRDSAGRRGPRGKGKSAAEDAPSRPAPIQRPVAGTPAYMAPEQARDALAIDGRADVYALGCTFYQLVTGRVPFARATATELIASHQDDPLIPPQEFAPGLPAPISDAILAMTRKAPEERYPSMGVVIDVLEDALGLRRNGPSADEAAYQAAAMDAAAVVRDSPEARLRRGVMMAAGGAWLGFLLLLLAIGAYRPLVVVGGFGLLTAASLALASPSVRPSGLAELLREVFLGDGLRSWFVVAVAITLLLGLTMYGGFLVATLFLAACVGGLLAAFHYYVDRPFLLAKQEAVGAVVEPLRRLRRAGVDERRLRDALIVAAGRGWEPLFASLFGERALAAERLRALHDPTAPSGGGGSWLRPRIECALDALIAMRRDARLRHLFQEAAEARFEAEGLNLLTARRLSWRVSHALIRAAAEWRDEQAALEAGGRAPGAAGPTITQHLRDAVEDPDRLLAGYESGPGFVATQGEIWSQRLFGRTPRVVLGAGLLAVFAYWMHSHGVVTADQVGRAAADIGRAAKAAAENADPEALRGFRVDIPVETSRWFQPLGDSWVPTPFRAILAANVGAAGLLLVFSALFRSRLVGFFALLAAVAVLLGPTLGLTVARLTPRFAPPTQAMLLGATLLVVGLVLSRR